MYMRMVHNWYRVLRKRRCDRRCHAQRRTGNGEVCVRLCTCQKMHHSKPNRPTRRTIISAPGVPHIYEAQKGIPIAIG